MSEWQFTCMSTRKSLCFTSNRGIPVLSWWFWPFQQWYYISNLQFTSMKPGMDLNAKKRVSIPWAWFLSGENHRAGSWRLNALLVLTGALCPWWIRLAVPASLSRFNCGPAAEGGTKAVLMPPLKAGKDQGTCLSASLFADTAFSPTSAFRNWGNVSHQHTGREVCYARCESAQRNAAW